MMIKQSLVFTMLIVGLSSCGPSEDPSLERRVELSPDAALPVGAARLDTGLLHVEASGLERLVDAHHVVWVDGGDGPVNAGPLEGGELATDADALGVMNGWRCFVTEEETVDAELPSSRRRLDGAVGEAMHFDDRFSDDALAEAGGDCMLSDYEVDLGVEGLPDPPDGLRYTAWAVCPHLEDHHHDEPADTTGHDDEDGHHDEMMEGDHDEEEESHHHYFGDDPDPDSADDAIRLGTLDMQTLHMRHHDRVGGCESVFVTLESTHGVDEPSPIVLMHGDVSFPEDSGEHEPHMH